MEKVCSCCDQPSDQGRIKNRTGQLLFHVTLRLVCVFHSCIFQSTPSEVHWI